MVRDCQGPTLRSLIKHLVRTSLLMFSKQFQLTIGSGLGCQREPSRLGRQREPSMDDRDHPFPPVLYFPVSGVLFSVCVLLTLKYSVDQSSRSCDLKRLHGESLRFNIRNGVFEHQNDHCVLNIRNHCFQHHEKKSSDDTFSACHRVCPLKFHDTEVCSKLLFWHHCHT